MAMPLQLEAYAAYWLFSHSSNGYFMKVLTLSVRVLFSLYAFLVFVLLMLLVFPLVAFYSFFGRVKGGNMICRVVKRWADCWYLMIGIRHRNIYHSPDDTSKTFIFVANHISYLDIPCFFHTIRGRTFRALGKSEMERIPIFGFIYKRGAVMVDRTSATKRAQSVRLLKSLLRKHISVCIFPEGTFNETGNPLKSFYDGAFRIAIETQTAIKPILFLDNHDRMHYRSVFSMNPGKSRAVFLDEISPEGYTIQNVAAFREKVYEQMEFHLRAYKASWIVR
jgi:1-acyl-sn-glycerol-3-phosphate acyltransferase